MGTEFYVYENFDLFQKIYELDFNDLDKNQKIFDFYTWTNPADKKDHLIITTNYQKEAGRPDITKTVIFLHGDDKQKYLDEWKPKLVEWDQVRFKKNRTFMGEGFVEFGVRGWFPFKSPIIKFPCSYRTTYAIIPRKEIITGYWLYDMVRDRVNLIPTYESNP